MTDNIAKHIQPVLTSKTNPNGRMRMGVYELLYTAEDTAGNKAFGCKIKLVIKSMLIFVGFSLKNFGGCFSSSISDFIIPGNNRYISFMKFANLREVGNPCERILFQYSSDLFYHIYG